MAKTEPMTSDPEFLKKLKKSQEAQKETKKLADEMRRKAKEQAKAPKEAPPKAERRPSRQAGSLSGRRLEDVKKSRGPFGTLAKQGPREVVEYKKPGGAVVEYKKPSGAVVKYEPKTDAGGNIARAGAGLASRMGLRFSGPVGALIGMTEEVNKGERGWIADKSKRGPLMKGANVGGKTFDKGKGTAALPKTENTTKIGVTGGAGIQGYGRGREGNYVLGKDVKERKFFSGEDGEKAPIPKPKPARDKSRLAGKSNTRKAFEAEFAKQRKSGAKEFTFRGKRYTTKVK